MYSGVVLLPIQKGKMTNKQIRERLFSLKDEKYRDFSSSLVPTVAKEKVIGVRTPMLRSFAKELLKEGTQQEFMTALPHKYFEEDNLHALLIMGIKDFDSCIALLREFLPFVDNWATCDMLSPKILKKEPERLLEFINELLESDKTYEVRYGIGLLLSFYLDGEFHTSHLEKVAGIRSDEYYINMMIAWYFATALAKQYESTLPFLEKKVLPRWVHNKTIQKARESYRVSEERKEYLKTLKIK